MPIHPKTDDVTGVSYGEWVEGFRDVVGYETQYEVNHLGQLRNKKTQKLRRIQGHQQVLLFKDKINKAKQITHLMLEAFFPHIPRNGRTCDHIDENYKNNYINNLWWQENGQQVAKSNCLRPRNNVVRLSKPVCQWTLNKTKCIQTFQSASQAGRVLGIPRGNISACACGNQPTAGGFSWTFAELDSQKDLPGEEWKSSQNLLDALANKNPSWSYEKNSRIQVSNLGRIKTVEGIKTKGTKEARGSVYRRYKGFGVHQLVWLVWSNQTLPRYGEDYVIMHSDGLELDEEGCVSNAIQHLKLGTKSENMIAHFESRQSRKNQE